MAQKHPYLTSCILAGAVTLLATPVLGQSYPKTMSMAQETGGDPIMPGDLLHITVDKIPELEETVRVADDGLISFTLVGHVKVGGLAEIAAAEAIEKELRDQQFVNHPSVLVVTKEHADAGVHVCGQVAHPGVYPFTRFADPAIIILDAGGLIPGADRHITIKRSNPSNDIIHVTLSDSGDSESPQVLLRRGDLIIVRKQ